MKQVFVLFSALSVVALCATALAAQCIAPTPAELAEYLKTHAQSPEEYVVSKFTDHDVVIMGENHRIKHDVELIYRLIPLAHAAGVHAMATEFARVEDQPLIDSLLGGKAWDEKLAQKITFNQLPNWGFREYVDVFKAAWQVNQTLAEGAVPFRIIGVNCSPDYSVYKKMGDQEIDSLRFLARHMCGEDKWARIVLAELKTHLKMLVHCGIHHAFTRYLQPITASSDGSFIRFEDDRMGRHLYNRLGDRTFMIVQHSPWFEQNYGGKQRRPASGMFDSAATLLGADFRAFGVDVVGTPLECITDSTAVYAKGHTPFRLGVFCDGYIMQKRFADFETVTVIPDFVNADNLKQAQQQSPHPWFRSQPAEAFRSAMEQDVEGARQLYESLK